MIFTSRFTNSELKENRYTTIRISLGTPKWNLGYQLDGAIEDLMPFGLLKTYSHDKELFKQAYFKRLDAKGVKRIANQLMAYASLGRDIVLLCYEDITKDVDNWCHRTMFAEWWEARTGEKIEELHDPVIALRKEKAQNKPTQDKILEDNQISMFEQ